MLPEEGRRASTMFRLRMPRSAAYFQQYRTDDDDGLLAASLYRLKTRAYDIIRCCINFYARDYLLTLINAAIRLPPYIRMRYISAIFVPPRAMTRVQG